MERTMSVARFAASLICVCLLAALSVAAQKPSESFDKAIKETTVDLGVSPYYAGLPTEKHGQLRCHYFQRFIVKELDWGQEGDDSISIAPNDPAHLTPCTQGHANGENVISADDEDAGYFDGVKGNLVFLDASDCFDSGCQFGVYDSITAKKVFEDQRRLIPKGKVAEIRFAKSGDALVMRYPRVVAAECSLPQKNSECWNQILHSTGLSSQPMPKCIGYGGFDQQTGSGTSDLSDPSVVSFPVEVTIPGFHVRILPGPIGCWAGD
jgi:hypothetical protein